MAAPAPPRHPRSRRESARAETGFGPATRAAAPGPGSPRRAAAGRARCWAVSTASETAVEAPLDPRQPSQQSPNAVVGRRPRTARAGRSEAAEQDERRAADEAGVLGSGRKVILLAVPPSLREGARPGLDLWILASVASMLVSVWLLRGLKRGYRVSASGRAPLPRPVLRKAVGHHVVSVGNLLRATCSRCSSPACSRRRRARYFFTTWRVGSVFFIISAAVGTSLFADASRPDGDLAAGRALERQAHRTPARAGRRDLGDRGQVDPRHPRRRVRPARLFAPSSSWCSPRFSTRSRTSTSPCSASSTACTSQPPSPTGWRSRPRCSRPAHGRYGITGAGAGWLLAQTLGAAAVGADVLWRK